MYSCMYINVCVHMCIYVYVCLCDVCIIIVERYPQLGWEGGVVLVGWADNN